MPQQFAIQFAPTSGRNGRTILNGQIVAAGEWSQEVTAADISVRVFELLNPGYEYGLAGLLASSQSVSGAQNVLANQGAPPINAAPGNIIFDNKLFLNRRLNLFWDLPEIRIISGSQSCKMDEYIQFSLASRSNGGWAQPGGAPAVPPDVL